MTVRRLEPKFVKTFPTPLSSGVLYVSIEFTTCAHLCACGCGEEVITPLSPAQWSLTYDGREVSLHPSVGNWALPCQSHYIVDRSRILWSVQFAEAQIVANRARDRRALNGYGHYDLPTDGDDLAPRMAPAARKGLWARFGHLLSRDN